MRSSEIADVGGGIEVDRIVVVFNVDSKFPLEGEFPAVLFCQVEAAVRYVGDRVGTGLNLFIDIKIQVFAPNRLLAAYTVAGIQLTWPLINRPGEVSR